MERLDPILYRRLEVHQLMAYYEVSLSTAYSVMRKIIETYDRRSKALFVKDLANYDGYYTRKELEEFLILFKKKALPNFQKRK